MRLLGGLTLRLWKQLSVTSTRLFRDSTATRSAVACALILVRASLQLWNVSLFQVIQVKQILLPIFLVASFAELSVNMYPNIKGIMLRSWFWFSWFIFWHYIFDSQRGNKRKWRLHFALGPDGVISNERAGRLADNTAASEGQPLDRDDIMNTLWEQSIYIHIHP